MLLKQYYFSYKVNFPIKEIKAFQNPPVLKRLRFMNFIIHNFLGMSNVFLKNLNSVYILQVVKLP